MMEIERLHEDDRVRVSRLTLAEAEHTPVHTHEVDELSITIAGSSVQERDPDGFLIVEHLTGPGDVRLIAKGTGPHVLVNSGVGPYVAVLVEPKVEAPAGESEVTAKKAQA